MILEFNKVRVKEIIYIILLLTLIMGTLNDELGISSEIRYFNDVLIFILMIFIFWQGKFIRKVNWLRMKNIFIAMIIFTIINLFTVILNLVPLNLVVWAIRNTYRFFVFFWACILYLEKSDLKKIFEIMYKLQWLNLVLILYQFFALGLKQDYLGGIFGHGANAALLIYSILLLAYAIPKYIAKEYSLFRILFILITTSLMSVLAEIRIFFVLVVVIVITNFLLNKNFFKNITIILGIVVLFLFAVSMYKTLFPYVSLSIEAFIKEGNSTGGGYNISRLNAFSDINTIFFRDDIIKNLFGYGFGNCEYSSVSLFCSKFYDLYGHYNYRWFTSQWIFLETGYAGILSYIFILIYNFIYSFKCYKILKSNKINSSFVLCCLNMTIICIISVFYNSLLKADYGYIAFFSLSISGIIFKEVKKEYVKRYNKKIII